MLRAIIFDHDGTLVDSETRHYSIWREILSGFNVDFAEDDYARHYSGLPTQHNAETLVNTYQLDMTPDQLFRLKEEKVREWLARQPFELMPDARRTITACRQMELSLAIASGARRNEIVSTLETHDFAPLFNAVTCSEDVSRTKPAPDVYLLALTRLGLSAQECIAVEDSYSGLQSAKAAGLRCIAVPNRYSHDHDFSDADVIARGLAGVIDTIAAICAGRQ